VVEEVSQFKYLGRQYTDADKDNAEFRAKLSKAQQALGLYHQVLKTHHLTIPRKKQVLTTVVNSTLLYALDWTLDADKERQMRVFQKKGLRNIRGLRPKLLKMGYIKTLRYPRDKDVMRRAGVTQDIVADYKAAQIKQVDQLMHRRRIPDAGRSFRGIHATA